ncbi:DUF1566 domain-containing protein [Pseudomonadota bacterium]
MRKAKALLAVPFISWAIMAQAGNLDSPAPPSDAGSATHKINALYNQLKTGTTAIKRTGGFEEPSVTPGAPTGHTLDEVMGAAPQEDNTDGAMPVDVDAGKTYWGLRTDGNGWGLQTGTNSDGGGGGAPDPSEYPAPVERTGQITCFDQGGIPTTTCMNTGQDGELQKGIAWPVPRFTDNNDGTITDNLTKLIWLKDATCSELPNSDSEGRANWEVALTSASMLANGMCGLSDGSQQGDWHLPNIAELQSLISFEHFLPAIPNTLGTAKWSNGDPFVGVSTRNYFSSTTVSNSFGNAWMVYLHYGVSSLVNKDKAHFIWPVKGGE